MQLNREDLMRRLVSLQYERNDVNFVRNKFRVRGDVVEINLAYASETAIRVEFFGDEVDRISEVNPLTGEKKAATAMLPFSPPAIISSRTKRRLKDCGASEWKWMRQVEQFRAEGKLIEAQRIAQRTNYDVEMLQEVGTCKGVENYSAVLAGRAPGSTPTTLLDYFPDDFLLFVDESHVMLPQLRAMYGAILRARKMPCGLWFPPALRL